MDEINSIKRKEIFPLDLESVKKSQLSFPGRPSDKVHTSTSAHRSLELPRIQRRNLGIETGNNNNIFIYCNWIVTWWQWLFYL